jgi:hypothetical protein
MVKVPHPPQICTLPSVIFSTVLRSFLLYLPHLSFSPSKEAEKFQFGRWQYLNHPPPPGMSPSCFSIAVWRLRLKRKSALRFSRGVSQKLQRKRREEKQLCLPPNVDHRKWNPKGFFYLYKTCLLLRDLYSSANFYFADKIENKEMGRS